jgi:hypothetical protein
VDRRSCDLVVEGDRAFVLYDFVTDTPVGPMLCGELPEYRGRPDPFEHADLRLAQVARGPAGASGSDGHSAAAQEGGRLTREHARNTTSAAILTS